MWFLYPRGGPSEEEGEGCQTNGEAKAQCTMQSAPPLAAGQTLAWNTVPTHPVSPLHTAPPFLPLPQPQLS